MDGLLLALRVALSLGCVLALMWVLARRAGRGGGRRRGPLEVLARQGVGGKAHVVLLRAGGRDYLLGVTEQQVSVLHTDEATAPEFAQTLAEASTQQEGALTAAEVGGRTGPAHRSPVAGSLLDLDTWRAAARSLTGRDRAA